MSILKLYQKTLFCAALAVLLVALPNQAKAEENFKGESTAVVAVNSIQTDLNYQKKLEAIKEKIQKFEKMANEKIANKIFFDDELMNLEKNILDEINTLNDIDKNQFKKIIEDTNAKIQEQLQLYLDKKYNKYLNMATNQVSLYSDAASIRMANRNILDEARSKGDQINGRILNQLGYSDKVNLLNTINDTDARLNHAEENIADVENEIAKYEQDENDVYLISKFTPVNMDITGLVLQKNLFERPNTSVDKKVVSIIDENTSNPFIQTKPGDDSRLILSSKNRNIDTDSLTYHILWFPVTVEGSFEDITFEFSKDEACMDTTIKVLVEEK
jgi:hypothetical protein